MASRSTIAEDYHSVARPSTPPLQPLSPDLAHEVESSASPRRARALRKFHWLSTRMGPVTENNGSRGVSPHGVSPHNRENVNAPDAIGHVEETRSNGKDRSFQSTNHNDVDTPTSNSSNSLEGYKVYKRRFVGLLILALLNGLCGANNVLFTTITSQTTQFFSISLTRVNWLSNIFAVVYLVVGLFVPTIVQRNSIQIVCSMAAVGMVLGSWLRYAAACVPDIQSDAYIIPPYFLLFVGSVFVAVAQPLLQIIGPAFSELYFSPRSRLASTMVVALSNPLGQAITDIAVPKIVPPTSTHREIRLLLLIVASVTFFLSIAVITIGEKPPTPPSTVCELPRPSPLTSLRILFGMSTPSPASIEEQKPNISPRATITVVGRNSSHHFDLEQPGAPHTPGSGVHRHHRRHRSPQVLGRLSIRNRADFFLLTTLFGFLFGAFNAYSTLVDLIYMPYNFDSSQAGLYLAAFIIPGVCASGILAPIIGQYCPVTSVQIVKIFGPLVGLSYAGLIWIVKGRDMAGVYLTNILIGIFSFVSLPIILELAADVTYLIMRPEVASAILYVSANAVGLLFVVIMEALRGDNDSSPPFEMSHSLIFQGGAVLLASLCIIGLEAQHRRPDIKIQYSS